MSSFPFRHAVAAVAVALVAPSLHAAQADFNEVGRQMGIMLQNAHFARLPYNAETSRRFLADYLKELDPNRIYFTQGDVDRFEREYGEQLYRLLMQANSLRAATDIYRTYQQRVEAQSVAAKEILKETFDFTGNESIQRTRKDAPWPRDAADAKNLLRLQIKDALLSEALRRETLAKMAKEQGKPDPTADDRDPKEKVALRYERFLLNVRDADEEDIADEFFSAVSRAFDPHTEYMSFREMSRFRDSMKNELVGIGALLAMEDDGATKISGIVVNGPADKEGSLKLNERIVAVDSNNSGEMTDILFMKQEKVVDMIRGKEGQTVRLKVEPPTGTTGTPKIISIRRGKVEMKDSQASAEILEVARPDGGKRRLGWITLASFYVDSEGGEVRCSVDVEKLLRRLNDEKIDGLALDLRNNGGGSLEEVRRMTGFFTGTGPVVQEKNTLGQVQVQDADDYKPIYTGPMVVLIDKTSASASEILAGALQDYNRAVIVGASSTFGKGTVQQPMDIGAMLPFFANRERAGFLKATIRKFYRPSGSSTQLEGVASDIALPTITDSIEIGEKFLDHAFPHDRIRPASYTPYPKENLFLSKLKEMSQARVKDSKDFGYLISDNLRAKTKQQENKVSLNLDERRKELSELETQRRERNAESRERFKTVQTEDAKAIKFFKLTLDDLEQGKAPHEFDPTKEDEDYVRVAKDEAADLDDSPKWPSGMDPVKREGLMVLKDFVEVTANAPVANVTGQGAVVR
jgi:carboxyl-terminal processing protease